MDAELLALEGAPSVSAALRALRESTASETPAPSTAVRTAAELLLAYVVNALRDPRNPRVHRVRAGNPAFQRGLGRLGGCEGAMAAVGFEPRDRGTVFVLREVGVKGVRGGSGKGGAVDKGRGEVSEFSICTYCRCMTRCNDGRSLVLCRCLVAFLSRCSRNGPTDPSGLISSTFYEY